MQTIAALVREKLRREAYTMKCISAPVSETNRGVGGNNGIITKPINTNASNNNNNNNNNNSSHINNTSTSGATRSACWLCNKHPKFQLSSDFTLCFSCMRLTFPAYILPLIDTPERRQSDAAFIAKIHELIKIEAAPLATSTTSSSSSNILLSSEGTLPRRLDGDTVAVTRPSQAHFVMSSSIMRQRSLHQVGEAGNNNSNNNNSMNKQHRTSSISFSHNNNINNNNDDLWTCPQCTFLNSPISRVCGACQFHINNNNNINMNMNNITCPFCGIICKVGEERLSQCQVKNTLHIVWNCTACSVLNTIDSDNCFMCSHPFMWACVRCTCEQESCRTTEGLRVCQTCGAYNTPIEIMQTRLTKIQQEDNNNNNNSTGEENVEFGVNDAETIAEKMRQEEIEKANDRLVERMKRLGIQRINEQVPDGNCLFRALANQLFGHPDSHMLVRGLVVNYMRERAESYSVLFNGEEEWKTYLQNMRQSKFWGDELCLNAAARCFHVNIHVITSDATRWHLLFQHDELSASQSVIENDKNTNISKVQVQNSVCLFLLYKAPVHYDDVMPLRAPKVKDLHGYLMKNLRAILEEEKSWFDTEEDYNSTKLISPILNLPQPQPHPNQQLQQLNQQRQTQQLNQQTQTRRNILPPPTRWRETGTENISNESRTRQPTRLPPPPPLLYKRQAEGSGNSASRR